MNIAISELETTVDQLNDNDLLLVSSFDNSNDTYTSAKAKCKILLDIIANLNQRIQSLTERIEALENSESN